MSRLGTGLPQGGNEASPGSTLRSAATFSFAFGGRLRWLC